MWDFFSISPTYISTTGKDVQRRRGLLAQSLNDQCLPRQSAVDIQSPLESQLGNSIHIQTIRTEIRAFQMAYQYLTGDHTDFIKDQLEKGTWESRPLAALLQDGFDTWAKVEAARPAKIGSKTKKGEETSTPTSPIPTPAERHDPEPATSADLSVDVVNTAQAIQQTASNVVLVDSRTWERLNASFQFLLESHRSNKGLREELQQIKAERDALREKVESLEAASTAQSELEVIDESTLPGALAEALALTEGEDKRGA